MKIIIYQSNIIKIGGVETFTHNMAKALAPLYDVLVLYRQCASEQLERLSKFVRCEQYDAASSYKCDLCILASSWGGYPDAVEAPQYWQMIHANYKELAKVNYYYTGWERTTRHISVSKAVQGHFRDMYGIESDVIYNILDELRPTRPILKLVSATRLSGEKGYNRMVQLAKALKAANVKFRWTIFTDRQQYKVADMDMPEVVYMPPTYDIFDYIWEADYGVQLSDTEGYSYFINECLQYGTPVLVTNFDSVFESVEDGVSGYILDMDLSNLDINKIVNNRLRGFVYEPKTTPGTWVKLIGKPCKKGAYPLEELVKVRALINYQDVKLQRRVIVGEVLTMTAARAQELKNKNIVEVLND